MNDSKRCHLTKNIKAALGNCVRGLLLTLLFLAIASTVSSSHHLSALASNEASGQTVRTRKPKGERHQKHIDATHKLAASYYSLKDGLNASLMLSNQGPHPMDVRVVLFNLAGERLDLPAVTIEPTTVRSYDLGQWAAGGEADFQEGSLEVLYSGMSMELGGAVKMINAKKSLILDEELSEPEMDFASSRLEGVWWLPSRRAELRLVLSNVTNSYLPATVTIDQNEARTLTLGPHQTRVLNVSRGEGEFGGMKLRQFGGISISHPGNSGALLARGLIAEANVGYSQVIEFKDPGVAKSSTLNGAGLRLGKIDGKVLHPVAVASNTGTEPTVVTGRIRYTTASGEQGTVNLPEVRLANGETKVIDVEAAANSIGSLQNLTAGLEFDYTTAPGSVVVAAQSVSTDDNQVYRVSVVDALAQMSSSGKYPWDLTHGATTVVYIKNVTDEEHSYYLQASYQGGFWVQGIKTIAPHQTVALDLRRVKEDGVKDQDGHTLPARANGGQVYWVLLEPKDLTLIGRVEQAEAGGGMSFTTSCGTCCLPNFAYPVMTPDNSTVEVGDTTTFTFHAAAQYADCFGNHLASTMPAPTYGVTWWTDNPSVASISPSSGSTADVTAIAAGGATIYADWTAANQTYGLDCSDPDTGCGGFNGGGSMARCYSAPVSTEASAGFSGVQVDILLNGNIVTGQSLNVVVGQEMNLTTSVQPTDASLNSSQWTVPGTDSDRITGYTPTFTDNVSPTNGTVTPLTTLTNSSVDFYWVSGGDNRVVKYSATVNGKPVHPQVTFNVKRPTASLSATASGSTNIGIDSDSHQHELRLGSPDGPLGITFTRSITIPQGFSGDCEWVQVFSKKSGSVTFPNNQVFSINNAGLDDVYPYPTDADATLANFKTSDSPGVAIEGGVAASTDYRATMWLMFKPSGTPGNQIWVPLRKVSWIWTASATYNGTAWTITSHNDPSNLLDADSTDHPTWTTNATTGH